MPTPRALTADQVAAILGGGTPELMFPADATSGDEFAVAEPFTAETNAEGGFNLTFDADGTTLTGVSCGVNAEAVAELLTQESPASVPAQMMCATLSRITLTLTESGDGVTAAPLSYTAEVS